MSIKMLFATFISLFLMSCSQDFSESYVYENGYCRERLELQYDAYNVIAYNDIRFQVLPLDKQKEIMEEQRTDVAVIMAAVSAVRSSITDAHRSAARKYLEEESD